jgi:hypothetical protein
MASQPTQPTGHQLRPPNNVGDGLSDGGDQTSGNSESPSLSVPDEPNITPRTISQNLLFREFHGVETISIKIGEEIHNLSREKLLDFFWTDAADTFCVVC